jgi:hypothetical protein
MCAANLIKENCKKRAVYRPFSGFFGNSQQIEVIIIVNKIFKSAGTL